MDTLSLLEKRISANHFDTQRELSDDAIKELIGYATQAPSSFNIQHWRFVAVTDRAAKERLKAVAYGQQKVVDAAVTFIILGDLQGHEKLREILNRAVAAGIVPEGQADVWVGMATGMYGANAQMARDEAIRSASLATMALMVAAEAKGLVSGPMIGFDPEGVKREFGISDRYVPVMLLPVGYAAPGNHPRKPRLAVDEVLSFNEGRAFEA
jgi:nitroreductase